MFVEVTQGFLQYDEHAFADGVHLAAELKERHAFAEVQQGRFLGFYKCRASGFDRGQLERPFHLRHDLVALTGERKLLSVLEKARIRSG